MTLTALITGGNRGIGLEVARGLALKGIITYVGSRDRAQGEDAITPLVRSGLDVSVSPLDVTSSASVKDAITEVTSRTGSLDILVNCAGILLDGKNESLYEIDHDRLRASIETNALGALSVSAAAIPYMKKNRRGTIVNVSSGIASFGYPRVGPPSYRVSKAALNIITVMLAAELKDYNIAVNAVCPGWVATRLGGDGGRPVKDGAAGIIWAATLPDAKLSGRFFRDGELIDF